MQDAQILNDALVQPEVETCKRMVDLFMLFDCSFSMRGKRVAAANQAMRESINELKDVATQHPDIEHRLRCIAFSTDARWHIGPDPVVIHSLSWTDLTTKGCTSTGAAVRMLAKAVTVDNMPKRGRPPVMVLISDGGNTDGKEYTQAINLLDKEPWGAKAVRISIGIGDKYNRRQLEKFTNHPEIGVLEARNAVDLARQIRYATVTASIASIQSSSTPGSMENNVVLPAAPAPAADTDNINLKLF
jgi:uncharacterized protein YegL